MNEVIVPEVFRKFLHKPDLVSNLKTRIIDVNQNRDFELVCRMMGLRVNKGGRGNVILYSPQRMREIVIATTSQRGSVCWVLRVPEATIFIHKLQRGKIT